jgi:putative glycosyltransferase (TIGR04372 family)
MKQDIQTLGSKTLEMTFSLLSAKKSGLEVEKLHQEYSAAANLGRAGHMKDSLAIRKSILEEIYESHEISRDSLEYYPPVFHSNWMSWFGHQSNIFIHKYAQDFGIIPVGSRLALSEEDRLRIPVLENPSSLLDLTISTNSSWLKVLPVGQYSFIQECGPINHIFERTDLIRGFGVFMDIHSLFNVVCENIAISERRLSFPQLYLVQSHRRLLEFFPDLVRFDSFAVLHLRESGSSDDSKSVRFANYASAIDVLAKENIATIRIGAGPNSRILEPLEPRFGLFDLGVLPLKLHQALHPYLFTESKLVITTHSGVHTLPSLAKVPVVYTNCIAPAMNILKRSNGSLTLPKKFRLNGKLMSLEKILDSEFSYAELSLPEFAAKGVQLEENSSREISEAVKQVLQEQQSLDYPPNRIEKTMLHFETLATGRVPDSYLDLNPWFHS